MKSKFAKFVDLTVGAALIFLAAAAIFRYYTTAELAAFSAAATTACIIFMRGFIARKKDGELRLSAGADTMFYDFMFENDRKPAQLLYKGLKGKGVAAKIIGGGLYANGVAAYFTFAKPLDSHAAARFISRAKRHGASRAVVFCKAPPASTAEVDGFALTTAHGDDVYKLFASLKALPEHKYKKPERKRFAALRGALGRDRIAKYLMLSLSLFCVSVLTRAPVARAFSYVAAALFLTATVYNTVKLTKARAAKKRQS